MIILNFNNGDGARPSITFEAEDSLAEVASVMECSVFRLIELINELYVQEYDAYQAQIKIRKNL